MGISMSMNSKGSEKRCALEGKKKGCEIEKKGVGEL
jgi:hypothetical protein